MNLHQRIFGEAEEPRRISASEMGKFTRDFNSGKYGKQRFGQAFINAHGKRLGIRSDPDLFHSQDRKNSEAHIWKTHVG